MAAGISNRMKTTRAKVLHEVCGRPMLAYVLDACRAAGTSKIYVVVGYGADQVKESFADADDIVWVIQEEQKGTGHAVLCCKEYLADFDGQVFILCGDMPLIRAETLKVLAEKHQAQGSTMTLATAVLEDPSGYGRIIRNDENNLTEIIEHNDCTSEQLEIKEVNPSFYLFDNKTLFELLAKVRCDNVKHEYYLTDVLGIAIEEGLKVEAVTAVTAEEVFGANSRAQLSNLNKVMQQRIQNRLRDSGVTIVDPDNTWVDSRAKIGQDTIIEPFTYIRGNVKIGKGCRVGPLVYLDSETVLEDRSQALPEPASLLENSGR